MDSSLKKCKSYEEFIEDMKRKHFEVKEGKHLAFKGEEQQRFIRSESISYHYSEEVLRFRFDCREEYENMQNSKRIGRVIDQTNLSGGLNNWASGENCQTLINCSNWIRDNITNKEDYGGRVNFGMFLVEGYDKELEKIGKQQSRVDSLNSQMRELVKIKQAVYNYWTFKPVMQTASKMDTSDLSEKDLINFNDVYEKNNKKYENSVNIINAAIKKYGSIKVRDINEKLDILLAEKKKQQLELTRLKLNFEVYETIKYNYTATTAKGGYGIPEAYARERYAQHRDSIKDSIAKKQAKEAKKQERKDKLKDMFHLN
jgi:hypothetical protein